MLIWWSSTFIGFGSEQFGIVDCNFGVQYIFWILFSPVTSSSVYSNMKASSTPATRAKGEIACYSCFAKNFPLISASKYAMVKNTAQTSDSFIDTNTEMLRNGENGWHNLTEIIEVFQEGGLKIPVLAERCSDKHPSTLPNFQGSQIHFCPNTDRNPGACVKFKGEYKGIYSARCVYLSLGEAFVYRDCWHEMWKDKRPYHHEMSGNCYNDEIVQKFIASHSNTICFCEDDLCNRGSYLWRNQILMPLIVFLLSYLL